jgi:hypothetical protein
MNPYTVNLAVKPKQDDLVREADQARLARSLRPTGQDRGEHALLAVARRDLAAVRHAVVALRLAHRPGSAHGRS